ncbi:MAG: hypothetical protein K8S98_10425 [Planctomycetes bacterium]|nr:hypothetical protein [Planctomycetota bacterium]
MNSKFTWTAVAIVVAVACFFWWPRSTAIETARGADAVPSHAATTERALADEAPTSREPASSATVATPDPRAAAPRVAKSVGGRAVDLAARPIAGLRVEVEPENLARWEGDVFVCGADAVGIKPKLREALKLQPAMADEILRAFCGQCRDCVFAREVLTGQPVPRPSTVTDDAGIFELAFDGPASEPRFLDDTLCFVATAKCDDDASTHFVLAPSVRLAGDVVDASGAPLADVQLELGVLPELLTPPAQPPNSIDLEPIPSIQTDALGRFEFARAPGIRGQLLTAERWEPDGSFLHAQRTLDGGAQLDLHLVVDVQAPQRLGSIRGIVVDEHDAPIADAWVEFGQDAASSDERGEFVITLTTTPDPQRALTGILNHERAGRIADVGLELQTQRDLVGVRLVLAAASAPIRCRLIDERGALTEGWLVDLADPTPSGTSDTSLEGAMRGVTKLGLPVGADGRFELGGLLERSYRVRCWRRDSLVAIESEPVRPGESELVLRVPADAVAPRIAGRVVSIHGEPLANVTVRGELDTFENGNVRNFITRITNTDAQGRFEFLELARKLRLSTNGDDLEWRTSEIAPGADLENLTLVAAREMRVQVELAPSDPADRLSIVAGDGSARAIRIQTPEVTSYGHPRVRRTDGLFPMIVVPEDAATLILWRGDTELRRLQLALRWRELNVVGP